jgi:predicted nucleotidyltransferase
MKLTIDYLREHNMIAYEYIRGSHAYGLATETSDEDKGGVFICPPDMLLGLRDTYIELVSDAKSDVVFYEFGRWIELLLKSNPTALESLFIPKDCIVGNVHPIVQKVLDNRNLFLSKECFKSFYGYSLSQIQKARGLNKKIVNPMTERKDILDFCYTFNAQGSQPIKDWLKEHNLDQKYCGLVKVPNCRDAYGLYYDWAAYFKFENIDYEERKKILHTFTLNLVTVILGLPTQNRIDNNDFFHYKGIVEPDEIEKSNDVRLSSIPKGELPICAMFYNKDAYMCHCRDYKEYKEWEKNRNPVRYESNLNQNYDAKNIMHCMRLVRMAKELALGQGFNVRRTFDRQYLLDIRNHKFEYDDIMQQVENERIQMEEAINKCSLPDKCNVDEINKLLIDARWKYYDFNEF